MTNIYLSTKAVPYVYMCTHKITQEFYIGYREANKKPSTVDLPLYKTSSKKVRPVFNEFDWVILAEFFDGDDALAYEQNLIKEHWKNPLLLNKQYRLPTHTAFKANKGCNKGRKNPALSLRNKTVTPWNKGLTKADPRVASYARPHTEKGKALRSTLMKEWHKTHSVAGPNNPMYGVTRERFVCEHCGKDSDIANFKRWHGERCKLFPRVSSDS